MDRARQSPRVDYLFGVIAYADCFNRGLRYKRAIPVRKAVSKRIHQSG
jgi:hypothetical protein